MTSARPSTHVDPRSTPPSDFRALHMPFPMRDNPAGSSIASFLRLLFVGQGFLVAFFFLYGRFARQGDFSRCRLQIHRLRKCLGETAFELFRQVMDAGHDAGRGGFLSRISGVCPPECGSPFWSSS